MRKLLVFSIIAFLVCFASHLAHAATLVGYWPFEETSGSTVNDQSGFNNDGQLTGASRSTGKIGSGLSFNGTGGVTIPNSPSLDSLPGGFTMEAWINQTNFTDYQTIFWKTDRHDRVDMLHFQVGDNTNLPASEGRLYACLNGPPAADGPCDFEMIASRTVDLNEWHFVAWTYDESAGVLYDNGIPVLSLPFSDPWEGNDLDLLIGQHQELAFANFVGMIDEARIYHGALTQEEIIRDMNAVIPEPSTAVLLSAGLLGLALRKRKRFRSPSASSSLS